MLQQMFKLMKFMELTPVPVAVKIIQCIMSMTIVHFLGASCCLVPLSPTAFDLLVVRLARAFDIIESPEELAFFDTILDVHLGYCACSSHFADQMRQFREVFQEPLLQVDAKRAPNIKAKHYPT
jgi:hypothetical protein